MREACRAPSRAESWVGIVPSEGTAAEGYAPRAEPRESGRSESSPSTKDKCRIQMDTQESVAEVVKMLNVKRI